MDLSEKLLRLKPAAMGGEEWQVRLELAALYRAFDWLGWTESIYNHITARVPGAERLYLINPLQRACEIQVATDGMRGDNLPIGQRVLDETPARVQAFRSGPRPGGLPFDALLRRAGIRYEDLI